MSQARTSLIESIHFDKASLQQHYAFYEISYANLEREEKKRRMPRLAIQIYKAGGGSILSLMRHGQRHRFVIMVRAESIFSMEDPGLAVRRLDGDAFPERWAVGVLLTRALPRVLPETDRGWFEADGLFYLYKTKELPSAKGREIVTIQVNPSAANGFPSFQQYLEVNTRTFTPLACHRKSNGEYWRAADKKPRYRLDIASQWVTKDGEGEYIQRPRYSQARNRTRALDIIEGDLESFYKSRTGVVARFFEDFERAYAGLAHIELKTCDVERIKIPDSHVRTAYKAIHAQLRQHPIHIINKSDSPEASDIVAAELERMHYLSMLGETAVDNEMNILLVNPVETYQGRENLDPYKQVRTDHPNAVIQSCYPDNLSLESRSHIVEVLVKELLIKYEVHQRRFLIDYPALPEDAIFIEPIKPANTHLKWDDPWPWACARVNGDTFNLSWADEELVEKVTLSLTSKQHRALMHGRERPSAIYWPETHDLMLIHDTGAVTLPDYEMIQQYQSEIQHSHESLVPKSVIDGFIDEYSESAAWMADQLASLREAAIDGLIDPDIILKTIGFRRKADKTFHEFLAAQGYRLKASFRGDSGGPLEAMSGIWADHANKLYFAGPKGALQLRLSNFGHIYRLDAATDGIPDWYLRSLQVFHVRHRNPTVMPFIFKHLREFSSGTRVD